MPAAPVFSLRLPVQARRPLALAAALAHASSLWWAPSLAVPLLAGAAVPLVLWAHRRSLATRASAVITPLVLAPGTWVLAPLALVPLLFGPWRLAWRTPTRNLALAAIALAFAAGISSEPRPAAALAAVFATLAVTPYDRRFALCASLGAFAFAITAPSPVSSLLALLGASCLALPFRLRFRAGSRTGSSSGSSSGSATARPDSRISRPSESADPDHAPG